MKQLLTGTAVSNFGLESGSTGKVSHCEKNLPDYLSDEERQFRQEHLKDNLFISGKCSSPDEIKKHIRDSRKIVLTKRNRFEIKESCVSLPLPESLEGMSLSQKQKLLKELDSRYRQHFEKGFWIEYKVKNKIEKRFIQADCLGTFIHLNEKGKIHLHQIWDNKWKDEKGKWRWGWKGGSISNPQICSIQEYVEKNIFIPFCKELKWDYLTQQQNKKVVRGQYKKKLKIEDYKKLKSFEDQLKGSSSMSPELKELKEQFEERTGEKLNLASLNRYIDDSIFADKFKGIKKLNQLYTALDSLKLNFKGTSLSDIIKMYVEVNKDKQVKVQASPKQPQQPAPKPQQLQPKIIKKVDEPQKNQNKGFLKEH